MKNLTVIMYHYVRPIRNSRYPNIKGLELDDFLAQISFLKKECNFITNEDLIGFFYDQEPLPPNPALLTFDDGYLDHFLHVYPVLKKENIQGSFFVPVKTVEENIVLDVNKIHFILAHCADLNKLVFDIRCLLQQYKDEFLLKDFDYYYSKLAISNRFDGGDIIFIKRLLQVELNESVRSFFLKVLFDEYVRIDEEVFSRELYMDRLQLEHMVDSGMHVGIHGYDHYWWDKLQNDQLEFEISKSLDFLQSLGVPAKMRTACYPYGSYCGRSVKILQEKGCQLAFTAEPSVAILDQVNPMLIPRLDTNDIDFK